MLKAGGLLATPQAEAVCWGLPMSLCKSFRHLNFDILEKKGWLGSQDLREVEVKIKLVPLLLKPLRKRNVISKPIRPINGIDPYPKTDGIHTAISKDILHGSGGVASGCVFEGGASVFKHFKRAQVMAFVEERL